jgi:hypothetical protein
MALTKKQLEYQREYRERTKNAANKKYYAANKEKIYASTKAWKEANPDKVKITAHKARQTRVKKINNDFDTFINYKYAAQRSGARRRGLPWNLTKVQFRKKFEEAKLFKFCKLTGIIMSYKIGDIHQASLDRIDNRYGYSVKNTQVVSAMANKSRMDLTIKQWDKLCISRAKQLGYHK